MLKFKTASIILGMLAGSLWLSAEKNNSFYYSKGAELYIQYDTAIKQWRFGLLSGTNRVKGAEEIKSSMTITGLDGLKKELDKIPPGVIIFIIADQWPGKPEAINASALDEKTQKELIRLCSERELRLDGMVPLIMARNRIISFLASSAVRRQLSLAYDPMDGEGVKLVPEKFPNLEVLSLRSCNLVDASLSPLGKMINLKSLDFGYNNQIGGQSFEFAAALPQLEQLDFSFCEKLTDAAIADISKCGVLRSLNLSDCKSLTPACLSYLAAIKSLQNLNLYNSGISLEDDVLIPWVERYLPQCKIILPGGTKHPSLKP